MRNSIELPARYVRKVGGHSLCLIHPVVLQFVVRNIHWIMPAYDVGVLRVRLPVGINLQTNYKYRFGRSDTAANSRLGRVLVKERRANFLDLCLGQVLRAANRRLQSSLRLFVSTPGH